MNKRLQSVVKKAQRYGYHPNPFQTLDELRQELDEILFHLSTYNPTMLSTGYYPNPKMKATTFLREPTT